ncbi:MAG: gamma-glutamyltransferase, partial [Chloroflexi bacterium]|nr:gamma-glutamyltransferase [Chloroflexota bacterium]
LNDRLRGFSLHERSPNTLAPGRRPVHTLNTVIALDGSTPRFVFGTPGAQAQVQSNFQLAGVGALRGMAADRLPALLDEAVIEESAGLEVDVARVAGERVAVGERELLDLDHRVHQLGAAPPHRHEVQPVRDRDLLEQDVSLRDWRLSVHAQSAVLDGDRLRRVGAMRREVLAADGAAGEGDPLGQPFGDRSAVERVRAVPRDLPQRPCEIGLLEHLSRTREPPPRHEDARALRVGRDERRPLRDRGRQDRAHREAVLGVGDRRREDPVEPEAPVGREHVAPAGDAAGHRGHDGSARRVAARAQGLDVDRAGGRAGPVVGDHLALPRVVHEREDVSADRGRRRLGDRADRRRRDRRIRRAAPVAERGDAGLGGEVVSGRHGAVRRADRGAIGHGP